MFLHGIMPFTSRTTMAEPPHGDVMLYRAHQIFAKRAPPAVHCNFSMPRHHGRHGLQSRTFVKGRESEEYPSGEDNILDEQILEEDLKIAVRDENYAQAAHIRDNLRQLQEDCKASILAANAKFYNAFSYGDLTTMKSLWAQKKNVYCVHPGANRISTYDLVMQSWEIIWEMDEFPIDIKLEDIETYIKGDMGYVTCVECVKTGCNWGRQVATNVFEKIDGQWFICVHHASHVGP